VPKGFVKNTQWYRICFLTKRFQCRCQSGHRYWEVPQVPDGVVDVRKRI